MIRRLYLKHIVLPRIVRERRESFETRDFAKRRAAAMKNSKRRVRVYA